MEKSSESNDVTPKQENTRAGGADDARVAGGHQETKPEEHDDVPRGAPEDTRSALRS